MSEGARAAACALTLLAAASCSPDRVPLPRGTTLAEPVARVETEPVATDGDSADDPAIWVHPADPALSLVIGTNKKGGLEWYGLDGHRLGRTAEALAPNNVDVAYAIALGERRVDVAGAGVTGSERGFQLWTIDPHARALVPATERPLPVMAGSAPYGSTLWRRARDGALSAFVTDRNGRVEQHAIDGASGAFTARLVRTFHVGEGEVEGCVADEELGWLYVSEEARGIWRYAADPDAPATPRDRVLVVAVGQRGIVPELEGLTIYCAAGTKGYLIASMQGANRFLVLEREPPNRLLKVIDPRASATIGDVEDTDGICVESFGLAPPFERGLLVVQDGENAPHHQNFKLYAWPDVAGVDLAVHSRRDPRRPVW